ncbi:MAG: carbohydrate kinase family protein [Fimbriimonas sp.]|nr:carbohydrate kinase family protein [Fimbriimonas sp.]
MPKALNDVLVAGHICLDIIPGFLGKVTFDPGRLFEVGDALISTGGVVSNTGQALHKLGIKTALAGKIGDDLFGKAVCDTLERCGSGLSRGMTVSPTDATSYTVVINLSGEDRMFLHAPGCNNTFVASDVTDQAILDADLVHFGYPTLMARMFEDDGRETLSLFERAKRLGATTSLDVSLPDLAGAAGKADWRKILTRVLPYTDLFLPSAEELVFMLDRSRFETLKGEPVPVSEFERLSMEAISLGAKVIAVKAGSLGLYLRSRDELDGLGRGAPADPMPWQSCHMWAPVFEVDVKGTTGAGDATIAGLLMGWIRGMRPEDALRAAAAVGGCCCEQADAVTGVQSWPATDSRIRNGWSNRPLKMPSDWHLQGGVYVKA